MCYSLTVFVEIDIRCGGDDVGGCGLWFVWSVWRGFMLGVAGACLW